MSFKQSVAQLIVVEPEELSAVPLEVHELPHPQHDQAGYDMIPMEVQEPGEVCIVIDELPGAPDSPDPIEVTEEEAVEHKDEQDAKKSKKDPKWDWEGRGATGFLTWVKERCDDVPKHSGYDTAGLERAVSYLEKLDNEISRAMRLDLDGELDANQIEKVRATIDEGINRLHDRLEKVKKHKKNSRKKKSTTSAWEISESMVKQAQKITGVQGTFIVVDLLTSHIARVCINGMVSAGHDLENIFHEQVKKFGLNKREQACLIQHLDDMGYAMRRDRGYMPDDEIQVQDSDNFDFMANYNNPAKTWGDR